MNEIKKIKLSDLNFGSWPKSLQEDFERIASENQYEIPVESKNKLCHLCDYLFFEDDKLQFHSGESGIMSFSFEELLTYHQKSQYSFNKEPLFKSLGIKGQNEEKIIWDLTCGTGKDALLIYHFRKQITCFERNPVVYLLLKDALRRFPIDMQLYFGNPQTMNLDDLPKPDVIYFDPMYPEKKKKSALPRKEMVIFKEIVGDDEDAQEVFKWAMTKARERVVVKRPLEALCIKENPTASYKGKSTRYDMYKVF
jgi:16S rRNA (guanine1516-N2)-methyltransferase